MLIPQSSKQEWISMIALLIITGIVKLMLVDPYCLCDFL